MTEYTVWSRSDFKSVIRREMMDTSTRWFSDNELNYYLDQWLQEIQQEFEFTWGISTLTIGTVTSSQTTTIVTSTGTITYKTPPQLRIGTASMVPSMLRNEAVYYNGFRLAGRNLQDLEVGNPTWRGDLGNGTSSPSDTNPYVYDTPRAAVMYPDSQSILIWPCPPPPTGTLSNVFVFEYPVNLVFGSDAGTSGLPVWTQWCAKSWVCMKLYQRPGPINDARKAARYRAQYERARLRVRRMWDSFMPERYRRLQPGQHYEWEILTPPPAWDCGTNTATGFVDQVFQSYVLPYNGTPSVTVPVLSTPIHSIQVFMNGVMLTGEGVDYALLGVVVTFTFQPSPSDIIIAQVT